MTVWRGFSSAEIIGPYLFRKEAAYTATVNRKVYRSVITNFVWLKLEKVDLENFWFQQDVATYNPVNTTFAIRLLVVGLFEVIGP